MTSVPPRAHGLQGGHSNRSLSPGVVVMVVDRRERAALAGILRPVAQVVESASIMELAALLSALPDLGAVISEPRDADGRTLQSVVEADRRRGEGVAWIAYAPNTSEDSQVLMSLARAGVTDVIFRPSCGSSGLSGSVVRHVLESALNGMHARELLEAVCARVDSSLHPFVTFALFHPTEAITVEDAALGIGIHRRTLVKRCARASMVGPRELLVWVRLLLAARYLESSLATIERIALSLAFPSPSAFRNVFKRYTGSRASEVRAQGGFTRVLSQFDIAIACARRAAMEAGSGQGASRGRTTKAGPTERSRVG